MHNCLYALRRFLDYNSEVSFYMCSSRGLSKYFFEDHFFFLPFPFSRIVVLIESDCSCPCLFLTIIERWQSQFSEKEIVSSCPPEIDLAPWLLLTLVASRLIKDAGRSIMRGCCKARLWRVWQRVMFTRVYKRAAIHVDSHWIVSAHDFRNWTWTTASIL